MMEATTEEVVRARQREFDEAELRADEAKLRELIAEDFLSIGPKGFVLDKTQWIGRHAQFKYFSLETREVDVRCYEGAAIVRNVQHNKADYNGEAIELTVRVSQVWVSQGGRWELAGIQFSPMAPPER